MTDKEIKENIFTHNYGGNGWVITQVLPNNFFKVARYDLNKKGDQRFSQHFLARGDLLVVDMRGLKGAKVAEKIPAKVMPDLIKLRQELQSGKKRIVNTRVKAR